jgi:hypothetical protein
MKSRIDMAAYRQGIEQPMKEAERNRIRVTLKGI